MMPPRKPYDWLVLAVLFAFAALSMWAAKVQLDYLPKLPAIYDHAQNSKPNHLR